MNRRSNKNSDNSKCNILTNPHDAAQNKSTGCDNSELLKKLSIMTLEKNKYELLYYQLKNNINNNNNINNKKINK